MLELLNVESVRGVVLSYFSMKELNGIGSVYSIRKGKSIPLRIYGGGGKLWGEEVITSPLPRLVAEMKVKDRLCCHI